MVDGEAVGSSMAPALVISSLDEPFSRLRVVEGRLPARPGEVAILDSSPRTRTSASATAIGAQHPHAASSR